MATVATTITAGRSFSGRTYVVFTSRSSSFHFSRQQEQEQHSLSHYHGIYMFLLEILVRFLKLKYVGSNPTPYETHPKTMFISFASFVAYSLAYDYVRTTPVHANVVLRGVMVLDSLTLVSLASAIFPDSIRPVLFLLYVLFSVMVNVSLVQMLDYIQRRMRGNLVTRQRGIARHLIYPSSSVAHGYISREGRLPV